MTSARTKAFVVGWALSLAAIMSAQTTAIPVPAQLQGQHSVFLASGGGPSSADQALDLVYDSFYQALLANGRYHMVNAPADAEISMAISLQTAFSDVTNGSSIESTFVQLQIYDVKTHTLLWTLDEPIAGAFREKSFEKNVANTTTTLMKDLNTLDAGTIPGLPASDQAAMQTPKKLRFSQEGK